MKLLRTLLIPVIAGILAFSLCSSAGRMMEISMISRMDDQTGRFLTFISKVASFAAVTDDELLLHQLRAQALKCKVDFRVGIGEECGIFHRNGRLTMIRKFPGEKTIELKTYSPALPPYLPPAVYAWSLLTGFYVFWFIFRGMSGNGRRVNQRWLRLRD